jgi:membrane associated rhomboid family serine protease
MEGFMSWKMLLPTIYTCAVAASFFSVHDIPTVGASGMIYAMFGMISFIVLFNQSTWKQKRVFFLSIIFMLLFSYFNKSSNFGVHILSFMLGFSYYLTSHYYDKREA